MDYVQLYKDSLKDDSDDGMLDISYTFSHFYDSAHKSGHKRAKVGRLPLFKWLLSAKMLRTLSKMESSFSGNKLDYKSIRGVRLRELEHVGFTSVKVIGHKVLVRKEVLLLLCAFLDVDEQELIDFSQKITEETKRIRRASFNRLQRKKIKQEKA